MATLNQCKSELRSIISELEQIEAGIRAEFKGIGQDICADAVSSMAEHYRYVQSRIENIDYNFLADWALGDDEILE